MRYRIARIIFIMGMLIISTSQALAGQVVNFTLPIHLSHMLPDITDFRVYCTMYNKAGVGVAYKIVTLKMNNGKYDGVVHIHVPISDADIPKVSMWQCGIGELRYNNTSCSYIGNNPKADECKTKPGSHFVFRTNGPLRRSGSGSGTTTLRRIPTVHPGFLRRR